MADERLAVLAGERGLEVERRLVTTAEEADALGFRGSPTILIDGHDPFVHGCESTGLACRLYATPDGLEGAPTIAQLRAALSG